MQFGIYGTQGTADPANRPGSRSLANSWVDDDGHFWLFGGEAHDEAGNLGNTNDLWKFDGTNWTWIKGSKTRYALGTFGTQNTAAPANTPSSRYDAMSWRDEDGNFWLFGGQGYDTSWNWYEYGDLWKFDGEDWTWVSGPQNTFQAPVYGTLGQFGAANTPGSRSDACTTLDDQGDLWLFGGYYYDANAGWEMVHLTDLWKFNGSQWAWMGGSQDKDILGVFGTKGIYAAENTPPSLKDCSLFATADDEIILFGGRIIDDSTGYEYVYYDAPDGVLNLANGLGFLDTADLMQI